MAPSLFTPQKSGCHVGDRRPRLGLITPYYWPEVAASVPLMTSLAADLINAGWEVTVLTSKPAQTRMTAPDAAQHAQRAETAPGERIVRMRNPFARRLGIVGKLLEYAAFACCACARVLFRAEADVYFVSSNPPLLALPIAMIARLRGTPVVYNLQDLFPQSAVASGLLRQDSIVHRVLRSLEGRTYRTVACVTTITEGFRKHVERVTPEAHVQVLPNWVDLENIRRVPLAANGFAADQQLQNGKVVALYAGNLGFLHGVGTLLDAAAGLRHLNDLVFVIVGDGQDLPALKQRAAVEQINNVRFVPFQPFSRIGEVYSRGDIGVVLMRSGASATAVPSKTWNIMACARPVVAAIDADSELAEILNTSGGGVVVPPGDSQALGAAIEALHTDPARRDAMGMLGRQYVEKHLSRRRLTARYAALLAQITKDQGLQPEPRYIRP